MNKKLHSILAAIAVTIAVVVMLTGCKTPPSPVTIAHIATSVKIVSKDATFLYLQSHPGDRAKFQQAHDTLAIIETAEAIDFSTVLKIVQTFPIRELKNPTTIILIQDGEILLTDLGATIPLDRVNDLRPIVVALREGIEMGLAQ